MTEETIMLMEQLIDFHHLYESDYESFQSRFNVELAYWYNLKQLQKRINHQFDSIKPFTRQ